MKIRKDFVTNSSSSSFVCEICGRTESGWDMCLSEADMVECVNGHIFCTDEMLEKPTREEMIKMILEYKYNDYSEEELSNQDDYTLFTEYLTENGCYGLPEEMCPICQFVEYSNEDFAKYLEKKYKVSRDEVFAQIKQYNKRRKKLYDSEYVTEVCKRFDLNPIEVVAGLKAEFGTYKKFIDYIYSRD